MCIYTYYFSYNIYFSPFFLIIDSLVYFFFQYITKSTNKIFTTYT